MTSSFANRDPELGAILVANARDLGFDDVGLVRADQGTPLAQEMRESLREERLGPLDWLHQSIETRADLQLRYAGARTVLVAVQSYYCGDHDDFVDEEALQRGARVSRYAWGADYHKTIRKKLRKLRLLLLSHRPEAQVWLFNDLDPVNDRAWAQAAGMGFIGKNGLFIHRKLGTWTFIGGLITDADLGARPPAADALADFCGSCRACMQGCPTTALVAPGKLDVSRCLTTWSIEKPHDAQAEHPDFLGHGWAAGCDICQEVCPWNRFQKHTEEKRFFPRSGHVVLEQTCIPEDLRGSPLARPGREGLQKNIARALARGHDDVKKT